MNNQYQENRFDEDVLREMENFKKIFCQINTKWIRLRIRDRIIEKKDYWMIREHLRNI